MGHLGQFGPFSTIFYHFLLTRGKLNDGVDVSTAYQLVFVCRRDTSGLIKNSALSHCNKENTHRAMASSSPTDLAKLLESVCVTNNGSASEEAPSNILGVEIPLEDRIKGAAGFIPTKFGL